MPCNKLLLCCRLHRIEDLLTNNKKNNSADAGEEERAGDISHEEEVDKMYGMYNHMFVTYLTKTKNL